MPSWKLSFSLTSQYQETLVFELLGSLTNISTSFIRSSNFFPISFACHSTSYTYEDLCHLTIRAFRKDLLKQLMRGAIAVDMHLNVWPVCLKGIGMERRRLELPLSQHPAPLLDEKQEGMLLEVVVVLGQRVSQTLRPQQASRARAGTICLAVGQVQTCRILRTCSK